MQNIKDLVPRSEVAKEVLRLRKHYKAVNIGAIGSMIVTGVAGVYSMYATAVLVAVLSACYTFVMIPNEKQIKYLEEKYNLGENVRPRN